MGVEKMRQVADSRRATEVDLPLQQLHLLLCERGITILDSKGKLLIDE
jgi:hypothetical protein